MPANEFNAYYDPTRNQIVLPAGILQSPLFSQMLPPAVNYGGAGGVMGHELTHGFDNQGSSYDGTGKLRNWWQPQTKAQFDTRVKCLIDMFNTFEPLPGVFVNGKLTQGENTADLGGTKLAYYALKLKLGNAMDQPSVIPKLSNKQLFWVSYAQVRQAQHELPVGQTNNIHSFNRAGVELNDLNTL